MKDQLRPRTRAARIQACLILCGALAIAGSALYSTLYFEEFPINAVSVVPLSIAAFLMTLLAFYLVRIERDVLSKYQTGALDVKSKYIISGGTIASFVFMLSVFIVFKRFPFGLMSYQSLYVAVSLANGILLVAFCGGLLIAQAWTKRIYKKTDRDYLVAGSVMALFLVSLTFVAIAINLDILALNQEGK